MVEELAKKYRRSQENPPSPEDEGKNRASRDFDILKKHLTTAFKTPVRFYCDKSGKGKITFTFKNEDELERLITIFDNLKHHEN